MKRHAPTQRSGWQLFVEPIHLEPPRHSPKAVRQFAVVGEILLTGFISDSKLPDSYQIGIHPTASQATDQSPSSNARATLVGICGKMRDFHLVH
jgi:hypothetical protein